MTNDILILFKGHLTFLWFLIELHTFFDIQ